MDEKWFDVFHLSIFLFLFLSCSFFSFLEYCGLEKAYHQFSFLKLDSIPYFFFQIFGIVYRMSWLGKDKVEIIRNLFDPFWKHIFNRDKYFPPERNFHIKFWWIQGTPTGRWFSSIRKNRRKYEEIDKLTLKINVKWRVWLRNSDLVWSIFIERLLVQCLVISNIVNRHTHTTIYLTVLVYHTYLYIYV